MSKPAFRYPEQQRRTDSEIRELIQKEDSITVRLPREIKPGHVLEELGTLKDLNSSIKYRDIVLYSEDLGALHLARQRDQLYWDQSIAAVKNSDTKVFFDWVDQNQTTIVNVTYNPAQKTFSVHAVITDAKNVTRLLEDK